MATVVKSMSVEGIDGFEIEVEATTIRGQQQMISIIGLGDQAVKEAGERMQAALEFCGYDIPKDKRNYTIVAEDLEKSGIFDNNDSDIVHNPTRKVLTNDELAEIQAKKGKKKNDYNLN